MDKTINKKTPAYQQIKQYILDNIHSGEWRTGQVIPTEMRLTEMFGVSRMTVNRALKELSEERVLERRQGSGTFVAQQQFHHTFVEVRNIADDIRQAGKNYRAQVIKKVPCEIGQLPSDSQHLWTSAKELLQLDIIHYANDIPVQYERRWVDNELVPEFSQQNFNCTNTSDYLIKHVPLVNGHYFIQAKLPSDDIANALNMKPEQPALLLTRYTYSTKERVLTYVQMWHDGTNFQFAGAL